MTCLNGMTHWTTQSDPLKTVELGQPPTTTNLQTILLQETSRLAPLGSHLVPV